jgi:hypothetical protein
VRTDFVTFLMSRHRATAICAAILVGLSVVATYALKAAGIREWVMFASAPVFPFVMIGVAVAGGYHEADEIVVVPVTCVLGFAAWWGIFEVVFGTISRPRGRLCDPARAQKDSHANP